MSIRSTKTKPVSTTITEMEVQRRIAVAVQSEHAAGSIERIDAVLDAVKAECEACARVADGQWFGVPKAIRARRFVETNA
jgi:hypothetical protein